MPRLAGRPAPVVGVTLHECDAIGKVLLLSTVRVLVDDDKQTSEAVVLALMLGTGREITSFDAVVEQPWASVTVTVYVSAGRSVMLAVVCKLLHA